MDAMSIKTFKYAREAKIIVILLLAILSFSCVTQKRCNVKFPPETKTEIKIIEKKEIRDTTIFVPVPGDIQIDSVLVPVPVPVEFDYSKYFARAETQFAKAEAFLQKTTTGELQMRIKLDQKQQEIEYTIKNAIKENSTHTIETIEKVHEVVINTFWTNLYRWFFWIVNALAGGYIFLRLRKFFR